MCSMGWLSGDWLSFGIVSGGGWGLSAMDASACLIDSFCGSRVVSRVCSATLLDSVGLVCFSSGEAIGSDWLDSVGVDSVLGCSVVLGSIVGGVGPQSYIATKRPKMRRQSGMFVYRMWAPVTSRYNDCNRSFHYLKQYPNGMESPLFLLGRMRRMVACLREGDMEGMIQFA